MPGPFSMVGSTLTEGYEKAFNTEVTEGSESSSTLTIQTGIRDLRDLRVKVFQ